MREITFEEKKEIELNILKSVHSFCVENNIRYFLTFGTLIGAIRHDGFIPWDDDIDIFIPWDDYVRFVTTFKSEHYKCFSPLVDKTYPFTYSKVIDVRTTKEEPIHLNKNITLGIDIDVFPLNYYYEYEYEKNINRKWRFYCKLWNLSISKYWNGKILRDLILSPFRFVLRRFNQSIKKRIISLTNIDAKGRKPVGYITAFCTSEKIRIYDIDWFSSTILHKFEDSVFFVPSEYDKILTSIYGDYMKLPPVEKQKTHHKNKCFYI